MTQILHIRLLGEFSLTRNDERLTTVNTSRLQSLLAYLVLHRDTPQARQRLAFLLWPDSSESQARANLRNLIHQLRQALPQADVFLCAEGTTVQWRADAPCTLDVADLQATLARPATRSDLEQAVALYRGDLLPSCYDDWIMPEREQLRQAFVDALQRLIELLEQTRDYTAAIRHAQQLLQQDPLCEETYRWLMRLHAANDDHASALRVYHTCVTTLQAELATEPAPATLALYRSILANSLPASPVHAALNRPPLVGRQSEWQALRAAWQTAASGQSHCVILNGEAGIGKTRLARELVVQVQMAHGTSLVGECYAEGSAPYAAFAQMILTASYWPSDLSHLLLADLISLAPGLRVRYPDVPPNPPLDPQGEQQRLYESAFTFFATLANRAPLLLVLEDVHWADGGSLALVRSLARRFRQTRTPVLIVLTFREEELTKHKGLADLITGWNHERLATLLKLHRLDRAGTQAMLEALFAGTVTADFADRIYQETEGNPFFVEEMCKALIEGGQVYRENGGWQRRSMTSIEMPRSIRMAIEARLAALPETGQDVLRQAAVLGRRFQFDVLQRADPDKDEMALIAALEKAEQAQLLTEIGRGGRVTFEFAHALIPATLVEGLSGMRRQYLHRRALAALEKLHPEGYKVLAHHCLEANEDERALGFLLKAAARARTTFANAEAVANYQQALGVLNELLHEQVQTDSLHSIELQLHEDLGDVLELTGQHEEAWAAYQTALALTSSSDSIRRSRLCRRAGKTRETLRLYAEAAQAYQQAEMALGEEPAEATMEWRQEWVMIQLDRINLDYWQGHVQEMTLLAERVRPAIEQYGTPLQRSKFFSDLVLMTLRRDRYVISEETLNYATQAVSAAQESSNLGELAWAQFLLGFSLLWHWDLDKAEAELQTALQVADRTGDVTTKTRCLTYLTVTYRKRGDIEQVRSFAARSQEAATSGQMIEYQGTAQANQAWAARRLGKLQEASELSAAAWETMQKTVQAQMFCWVAVWPLLGMCLTQNQIAEAVDLARKLLSPATQPQPEALAIPLQAAIQAWEQGQPEQAAACLTRAAVLAEPLGYL